MTIVDLDGTCHHHTDFIARDLAADTAAQLVTRLKPGETDVASLAIDAFNRHETYWIEVYARALHLMLGEPDLVQVQAAKGSTPDMYKVVVGCFQGNTTQPLAKHLKAAMAQLRKLKAGTVEDIVAAITPRDLKGAI